MTSYVDLIDEIRSTITAQAARIAELEDAINRAHNHLLAKHYAVATAILYAHSNHTYRTYHDIKEKENGKDEGNGLTVVPRSREPRPDYGPAARGKSRLTEQLGFIWREGERPELVWAFTAEARGERYLKLIEQLGDDSTTFRAWWADIRR